MGVGFRALTGRQWGQLNGFMEVKNRQNGVFPRRLKKGKKKKDKKAANFIPK